MIKVYSIPDCPWCQKVKKYLDSKSVEYKDINVEEDMEGKKELVALTKQLSVPTISLGERFVIGFEREKLDELINY